MAKLKIGDSVKLNIKKSFGEYESSTVSISDVITDCGVLKYFISGFPNFFIQGGDDWQVSNEWRDRFYHVPAEPGGTYFTRI